MAGQEAQRIAHRAMGGTGFTPSNEESARGYDVEVATVKVNPEIKRGQQIPASLVKFLSTDWYRRALSQSTRGLPFGSGAKPGVWCHMPGGRKVLIIDFGGGPVRKEVEDGDTDREPEGVHEGREVRPRAGRSRGGRVP